MEFTFKAFFDLTGDRQIGLGMGPIPFISIYTYGTLHQMEDLDLEDFISLIREMDTEYLMFHREKSEREKK